MSLFRCDGCTEEIQPHKARIHCDDCVGNHNVCANCYVVGNYTKRHEESHSVSLIDRSGYQPKPPPVPPRPHVATTQPSSIRLPSDSVVQRRPIPQQVISPASTGQQRIASSSAATSYLSQSPVVSPPTVSQNLVQPPSFSPAAGPPPLSQYPKSYPPPGPPPPSQQPVFPPPPPGPPPITQQPTGHYPPGPSQFTQPQATSPPAGPPPPTQQSIYHPHHGPPSVEQKAISPPLAGPPPPNTPPSVQQPTGHISSGPSPLPQHPTYYPSPGPSPLVQQQIALPLRESSPTLQQPVISPPPGPPPPDPPLHGQQSTSYPPSNHTPMVQQSTGHHVPASPLHMQQQAIYSAPVPPPGADQATDSPLPGPKPKFTQQPIGSPLTTPPPLVQDRTGSSVNGTPPVGSQPVDYIPAQGTSPSGSRSNVQTGWQPLFQGSAPTPIMVAFLEATFACLDTDKDGLLTPEQYSAFLDVQGYGPDEDIWKKNRKELPGYTADDVADFELKTAYENFSIQHRMLPRPNAKTSDYMDKLIDSMPFDASFAKLMKDSSEKKSFSGGMMPMLTLPGFIDITVFEILYEPSPGWIRLNRIAQHYNIWREWGDVPRSMMPDAPPQELVTRVAVITQQSAARAQTMIDANALRLQIAAQGRENAIRSLDPPGTRYIYRHN